MIRSALTQVLWGILVIVVDVKIGWFDLLVDPIGYGVIFVALVPLGRIERNFQTAVPFAFIAIFVSVPAMFDFNPAQLVFLTGTVMDFLLFWFICTGILRLASSQGNFNLAASATRQRMLNVAAGIVMAATAGIAQLAPTLAPPLILAAVAFALVVMVLTLLMLRQASRELTP